MSCEHCVKELPLFTKPHDFYIHDGSLYHFDNKYGWEGTEISFCPLCGAPLTDPQPLTFSELRERNGRPVYTKTIGVAGSGRWEFIAFGDTWVCLKTAVEAYKMTTLELANSYGKSWLAYDRPPKENT